MNPEIIRLLLPHINQLLAALDVETKQRLLKGLEAANQDLKFEVQELVDSLSETPV